MPNHLASAEESSPWQFIPDSILFHLFSFLAPEPLVNAAQVCHHWHQVALDEFLWKELFYTKWQVNRSKPMAPSGQSWRQEFKRLHHHTPTIQDEVLHDHRDQVLHVSFSHDGELFTTCSKDGFVKVWCSSHPVQLKYYEDMKVFTWKYTQFSQFNKTDTLLLVSGVHFGSQSTSGEIAVFNIVGGFELQCRVINKPYDIFGTWYNERHLLSGNLHWLGNLTSCSVLWLNKADQALESEHEAVVRRLYKFHNVNASSIRTIMVAENSNSLQQGTEVKPGEELDGEVPTRCTSASDCNCECSTEGSGPATDGGTAHQAQPQLQPSPSMVSKVGQKCKVPKCMKCLTSCHRSLSSSYEEPFGFVPELDPSGEPSDSASRCSECGRMATPSTSSRTLSDSAFENETDKYLIFTMGTKTYTPHQIGVKRIEAVKAANAMKNDMRHHRPVPPPVPGADDGNEEFDMLDHVVELNGHIIGMCLSPDHRHLYVNSRAWPTDYHIAHALYPPPIAQEIDIHVIDLASMERVRVAHTAHKAYTPNDECFFIFLDVSEQYVASGAEDKNGYLWDRHYDVCLARFPHTDVVNCVAFNPSDPEMLVSVSDDHSVKIWRSPSRLQHREQIGCTPK